jgi:hypothetical protein
MRRLLLALTGASTLACAGASKPPPTAVPAAETQAVPAGFERQPDDILTEYDLNRDGKADVWKYSRKDPKGKEILLRKERDLNGDGRIDGWEKYGADGSIVRIAYDLDFDGKIDEVLHFEKDQLVKKELAFGFDGVPRSWSFYEKGKLVRKERDANGDGQVDYWEYWENGEVDRIGVDDDGDGQVDRWEARKSSEATAQAGADQKPAQ